MTIKHGLTGFNNVPRKEGTALSSVPSDAQRPFKKFRLTICHVVNLLSYQTANMASCRVSYQAAKLPSCQVAKLPSCQAVKLSSCQAVKLPSC